MRLALREARLLLHASATGKGENLMQMRWKALVVSVASLLFVTAAAVADHGDGRGSQDHQNEGGDGGNQGNGDQGNGNHDQGHGTHGGQGTHNGNGACIQGCVAAAQACRLAAHSAAMQCAKTCAPLRDAVKQNCAAGDGVSDEGKEDEVSDNGSEPTPSAACEAALQALKTCFQGCAPPSQNAQHHCLDVFQTCKSTQCGLPPGPSPTPTETPSP